MGGEHLVEGFREVLQEMKAVGHLNGSGRALLCALGVGFRRSRVITSTPGCAWSQWARVSAVRSGSKATGR